MHIFSNYWSPPFQNSLLWLAMVTSFNAQGFLLVSPYICSPTFFRYPFILPIQGTNVVLGMAWLGTLGTVLYGFSIPSMSFTHQGKHMMYITLLGHLPSIPP